LNSLKVTIIGCLLRDTTHTLVYPLVATIIYFTAFSYIEKKILKLHAKNKADRQKIVINELEEAPVSGEEYRELLQAYVSREKELNDFTSKERDWLNEKTKLLSLQSEQNGRINGIVSQLEKHSRNQKAFEFFKGRWELSAVQLDIPNKRTVTPFYVTEQNKIMGETTDKELYTIRYFNYNENSNIVHFIKENRNPQQPELFYCEISKMGSNTFEGTESGIVRSPSDQNNVRKDNPLFVTFKVTYLKRD
jgi:hypothetical protein